MIPSTLRSTTSALALVAGSLLGLGSTASSAPYLAAGASYLHLEGDSKVTLNAFGLSATASGSGDADFAGFSLRGGNQFPNGFALEVEGLLGGWDESDSTSLLPGATLNQKIDYFYLALFANGSVDLAQLLASRERGNNPWILTAGAGAGPVYIHAKYDLNYSDVTGFTAEGSDSDGSLALGGQAFLRAGYEFSDRVALVADAAYLVSANHTFSFSDLGGNLDYKLSNLNGYRVGGSLVFRF